MAIDLTDEQKSEIEGYLLQGRKIQAIKAFREYAGLGLKEAKDFIDKLEQRLEDNPTA